MFVLDEAAFLVELGVGDLGAGAGLFEQGVVDLFDLRAGDGVAGLGDLADVALEHIALLALALHALAAADILAELAAALLEGELHLLADLVVVGDGLLGLAGEGHPDRGHVDHDDEGADGGGAAGLGEAVVLPGGLGDGLEGRAGGLLVEQGDAVGEADDAGGVVAGEVAAEGDGGLDEEGAAAVDGGGAGGGGVELGLDALDHAGEHLLDADGGQAVGGGVGELGVLHGLEEGLGLGVVDVAHAGADRDLGGGAQGRRGGGGDLGEAVGQEGHDGGVLLLVLGVLEHLEEHAEFDALGVGHDLLGFGGHLVGAAGVDDDALVLGGVDGGEGFEVGGRDGRIGLGGAGARRARGEGGGVVVVRAGGFGGGDEDDAGVGVGDGGQFEELVDGAAAAAVLAFEFDGDAGAGGVDGGGEELAAEGELAGAGGEVAEAGGGEVFGLVVGGDLGAVGLGVHGQLDVVSLGLGGGAGVDDHGLAGGQQAVHAGGGDADALLAAGHLQAVELGAVEEAAEDVLDLLADDAGAVVGDGDAVLGGLGGGGAVGLEVLDDDGDVGEDAGLLAGVEGVVHGFLDGGQEGLAGVVEAEQVAVLGEELGDGDLALLGRHRFGGGARFGSGFLGHPCPPWLVEGRG